MNHHCYCLNNFYQDYLGSPLLFSPIQSSFNKDKPGFLFVRRRNRLVHLPYMSLPLDLKANDMDKGPDFFWEDTYLKCIDQKLFWEVRGITPLSPFRFEGKVLSCVDLHVFPGVVDKNANLKRKINKANRFKLDFEIGGEELLDEYLEVNRCFSNQHQIAAFSSKFYKTWLKHLSLYTKIALVKKNGGLLAGAFLYGNQKCMEILWQPGCSDYREMMAHYFLQIELMFYLKRKGIRVLSLGRSSVNSGVHQFKRQWSTSEYPLYFNYSHQQNHLPWQLKEYYAKYKMISPNWLTELTDAFLCKYVF